MEQELIDKFIAVGIDYGTLFTVFIAFIILVRVSGILIRNLYLSNSIYIDNLLHHRFRFGIKGNFKVLRCRIFGHRVSNDPSLHCCERCGLAYEEIYHRIKQGWYWESGILDKDKFKENGQYKNSIFIDEKEFFLYKPVYDYIKSIQQTNKNK